VPTLRTACANPTDILVKLHGKSSRLPIRHAPLDRDVTAKVLIAAGAVFLVISAAFIVLNKLAEQDAARALINDNHYVHLATQAESDGYSLASIIALCLSVVLLFLSGRRASLEKKCPDCAETVPHDASTCPFCKRGF
jgi:hypothetical protein